MFKLVLKQFLDFKLVGLIHSKLLNQLVKVIADMQYTFHNSESGVSILYYTKKINVHNFTFHVHETFCINWNEIHGRRGSTEFATAMNWWFM